MGIFVTAEEIDARLQNPNNVVHHIMHDGKGRKAGDVAIPEEVKIAAGALARSAGPTVAAEVFDISISQASNYSKGKTVHGEGNPELKERVAMEVEGIHEKARDLVLETLQIFGDKIDEVRDEKPRVIAGMAKDLAGIIEKTSPKNGGGNNVQINVYAPKQENIDRFETVVVPMEK